MATSDPITNADPIVRFQNVDIVFGDAPETALPLIDEGRSREDIQNETNQVVGVTGANFDVREGEVLVLMGLSGSGKSTLLRAVNGLNEVIRGNVLVRDGEEYVDPGACSAEQLRHLRRTRVAMVFQQFALLPWRTVAENVGFGLELSGVALKEREERVRAQLDLVGLSEWADMQVHELSGGMQQRVGLARAFATDAPILLMDEPFSALDPLIRARLQDELLEFQSKLGCTIIFVSHDLDEALKIGSRIAIMDGGKVVQLGTPQEIVRKPANRYVADFVAHMNPLNVLRAGDVMTSVDDLPRNGSGRILDADTDLKLSDTGTLSRAGSDVADAHRCNPRTPVRELIDLCLDADAPILIANDDTVVGIVRSQELLACLR